MSHSPTRRKRFKYQKDLAVFTPSGEDIALAHERSCAMGILPGSYMRGLGNLTGCLGEIAVNAYLPRSRYVGNDIFTHDIVYKKQKVEVKSKTCSGQPKPQFNAFVNCKEDKIHENDIFFFTRVRRDLARVYLVGWLPTPTLIDEATYRKVGDVDNEGFIFKSNGYQMPIGELNPPIQFKKGSQ
tara:strand:- start:8214 stop:8765 length:552 start_codon:yes stop_codon:yes gene_type:complete